MEIRHLRHVLAVADEAHFGRAAARLGMSQPPLTQSIQRIERQLGVALFRRSRTGVELTPAGAALVPEARAAVAAARRAEALAQAAAARDPVRIGYTATSVWGPLRRLLGAARRAGVPVALSESSTNDQLSGLAAGRLDFGLLSPPFEPVLRMQVRDLVDQPIMAAIPSPTAPPESQRVTAHTLAERFVVFAPHLGPVLHGKILGYFAAHGVTPTVVAEVENLATALALVSAGLGCTVVPADVALHVSVDGVAYRRLAGAVAAPRWPFSLAFLPLVADGPSARLLEAWDDAPTR